MGFLLRSPAAAGQKTCQSKSHIHDSQRSRARGLPSGQATEKTRLLLSLRSQAGAHKNTPLNGRRPTRRIRPAPRARRPTQALPQPRQGTGHPAPLTALAGATVPSAHMASVSTPGRQPTSADRSARPVQHPQPDHAPAPTVVWGPRAQRRRRKAWSLAPTTPAKPGPGMALTLKQSRCQRTAAPRALPPGRG